MKPWREAATLILAARISAARSSGSNLHPNESKIVRNDTKLNEFNKNKNEDYRVLFLKRSASSKFMPSRLVFPGGATHPIDWSPDWPKLFESVHKGHYNDIVSPVEGGAVNRKPPMIRTGEGRADEYIGSNAGVSADVAFRICAIRETFEECGLLLCVDKSQTNQNRDWTGKKPWKWTGNPHLINSTSGNLKQEDLERWRSEIQSNPVRFLDMCSTLGLVPNIHALVQWRNWLTPVVEERLRRRPPPPGEDSSKPKKLPRRFDTMFYMCCLDCDALPETSADEAETTTAEWYYPSELLNMVRGAHGEGADPPIKPIHLAPPQVYELTIIQRSANLHSLCDHAWSERESEISAKCWMPEFRSLGKGIVTILPGDYMYPEHIDFEGKDDNVTSQEEFRPPPIESLPDGNTPRLNRITYPDYSFQNGTVLCNVI